MHSQRLNDKPLQPWFITAHSGEVECAHCTCMAGLGESCTHVAALLFWVNNHVMQNGEKSVTDVKAYWTAPKLKNVKCDTVDKIDFSTPKIKKLKLNASEERSPVHYKATSLSKEDFNDTLLKLQAVNSRAAILNIVEPFCIKPDIYACDLSLLFKEEYTKLSLHELQEKGKEIELSVSEKQAMSTFTATTKQSKNALWHKLRIGRVTASKFKAVCRTKLEKPSLSLLKCICYPHEIKFTSRAMGWGCTHEKTAKEKYFSKSQTKHEALKLNDCGLIINSNYPNLAATPDGIIECACCGRGCIEIKCPYCVRKCSSDEIMEKIDCLEKVGSDFVLRADNAYFFQVQAQLFIGQFDYCDFIIWSENQIFIQRIYPDEGFWKENLQFVNTFFHTIILPELMGKAFTKGDTNKEPAQAFNNTRPTLVKLK